MSVTNIHEAKSRLSQLIEQAERGEEVIIARAGKPVARLVPYESKRKTRRGGQWRGKVEIAREFDQLPDDLAAALCGMIRSKAGPHPSIGLAQAEMKQSNVKGVIRYYA